MLITRGKKDIRITHGAVKDGYTDEIDQYRVVIFHDNTPGVFCGKQIYVASGNAMLINIGETAEFAGDKMTTVFFSPRFLAYSIDREEIERIALNGATDGFEGAGQILNMRAFFFRDIYKDGIVALRPDLYCRSVKYVDDMRIQMTEQPTVTWSCDARYNLFCLLQMLSLNRFRDPVLKPIEDTIAYIAIHFHENITLEKLSEISGINERDFRVIFRFVTGFTPGEYIREFRIKQACTALAYTDISLFSVARSNGFPSQAKLSAEVKRYKGMSPSEYRAHAVRSRKEYFARKNNKPKIS